MRNDDESASGKGGCSVGVLQKVPAKNQYNNCLPSDVVHSLRTSSLSQSLRLSSVGDGDGETAVCLNAGPHHWSEYDIPLIECDGLR